MGARSTFPQCDSLAPFLPPRFSFLASCGGSEADELASSVRSSVDEAYQRIEEEGGTGRKTEGAECLKQRPDRWRCKVTVQPGKSGPNIDSLYAVAFENDECWAGRLIGDGESSEGGLMVQIPIRPRAPLESIRGCL